MVCLVSYGIGHTLYIKFLETSQQLPTPRTPCNHLYRTSCRLISNTQHHTELLPEVYTQPVYGFLDLLHVVQLFNCSLPELGR